MDDETWKQVRGALFCFAYGKLDDYREIVSEIDHSQPLPTMLLLHEYLYLKTINEQEHAAAVFTNCLQVLEAQFPWDAALVRYLAGALELDALFELAGDDMVKISQAHYYEGAKQRAAWKHRTDWERPFSRALACQSRALERLLAFIGLSTVELDQQIPGLAPFNATYELVTNLGRLKEGEYVDPKTTIQENLDDLAAEDNAGDPERAEAVVLTRGYLLRSLAGITGSRGEHTEALDYHRRASAHFREHPELNWFHRAVTLRDHGKYCAAHGPYREATQVLVELDALVVQQVPELHHSYGDMLNVLGTAQMNCDDHVAALASLNRAIELESAAGEEAVMSLGRTFDHLGLTYVAAKQPELAMQAYERARAIFEASGEAGQFDLSVNCLQIGRLASRQKDFVRAERVLRQCVDLRRPLGPYHPRLANAYNVLGLMLCDAGRTQDAINPLQLAVRIYAVNGDRIHRDEMETLTALLQCHMTLRDRERVALVCEHIEREFAQGRGIEPDMAIHLLANASGALAHVELTREAVRHAESALKLVETHPDVGSAVAVHAYMSAGAAYRLAGDFANAARTLKLAIALLDEAPPDGLEFEFEHLMARLQLALLYRSVRQPEKSEALLREILEEAVPESHMDFWLQAIKQMGASLYEQHRLAEAVRYLTIGLNRVSVSGEVQTRGELLADLANLHGVLKNFDEALRCSDEAHEIFADLVSPGKNMASLLLNRAIMRTTLKQYEAALADLDEAEKYTRDDAGVDDPMSGLVHEQRGTVLLALARPDAAFDELSFASRADDAWIERASVLSSDGQRLNLLAAAQRRLGLLIAALDAIPAADANRVTEAATCVLRKKSKALEMSSNEATLLRAAKHPDLEARLLRIEGLRAGLAQASITGLAQGTEGQRVRATAEALEELEAELALELDGIRIDREARETHALDIAAKLDAGTVVIDWIRFERDDEASPARYGAFVYTNRDAPTVRFVVASGTAPEIEDDITVYQSWLESESHMIERNYPRPWTADDQDGDEYALAAAIGARIIDVFGLDFAGIDRLIVCPDGKLADVPFAALRVCGGERLIAHCEVQTLNTPRELLRFESAPAPAGPPVVIGAPRHDWPAAGTDDLLPAPPPEFDTASVLRDASDPGVLRDLPGARREAEEIAHWLNVEPWIGEDALKPHLQSVSSPMVLHIASHAKVIPPQQEQASAIRSGPLMPVGALSPLARVAIVLAGGQTFLRGARPAALCGNGLLSGLEARQLDLGGCRLCVLSACSTGVGEQIPGEGAFSLARAFLLAGARAVLLSLWNQSDEAASAFMKNVYSRLFQGDNAVRAVAHAQDALRKSTQFCHPFHWAGWSLVGEAAFIEHTALALAPVERVADEALPHATRVVPGPELVELPLTDEPEAPIDTDAESTSEDAEEEADPRAVLGPITALYAAGFSERALEMAEETLDDVDGDVRRELIGILAMMQLNAMRDITPLVPELERVALGVDGQAFQAMRVLHNHAYREERFADALRYAEGALACVRDQTTRVELPLETVILAWHDCARALSRLPETGRRAGDEALACLRWSEQHEVRDELVDQLSWIGNLLNQDDQRIAAFELLGRMLDTKIMTRLRMQVYYMRAILARELGRSNEAYEALAIAYELSVKRYGFNSSHTAAALHEEGLALATDGRPEDGSMKLNEAAEILERIDKTHDMNYLVTLRVLTMAYADMHDAARVAEAAHKMFRMCRAAPSLVRDPKYWTEQVEVVRYLESAVGPEAAVPAGFALAEDIERMLAPNHPYVYEVLVDLNYFLKERDAIRGARDTEAFGRLSAWYARIADHGVPGRSSAYIDIVFGAAQIASEAHDWTRAQELLARGKALIDDNSTMGRVQRIHHTVYHLALMVEKDDPAAIGAIEAALADFEHAADIPERQRSDIKDALGKILARAVEKGADMTLKDTFALRLLRAFIADPEGIVSRWQKPDLETLDQLLDQLHPDSTDHGAILRSIAELMEQVSANDPSQGQLLRSVTQKDVDDEMAQHAGNKKLFDQAVPQLTNSMRNSQRLLYQYLGKDGKNEKPNK
jgi:CHAT domain-containing protein